MKKTKQGGSRKGAGRKKGVETCTISIRHEKKIVDKVKKRHAKKDLQKLGKEWLNTLAETTK